MGRLTCPECGGTFQSLGFARHRASHRNKEKVAAAPRQKPAGKIEDIIGEDSEWLDESYFHFNFDGTLGYVTESKMKRMISGWGWKSGHFIKGSDLRRLFEQTKTV